MIDGNARQHEARDSGSTSDHRPIVVEVAVYRSGNVYRAVCLDLGLIVERPALDAALDELMQVIHGYVEDALEAGLSSQAILRPVPRRERLYVYRRLAMAATRQFLATLLGFGRRKGAIQREGFTHSYCAI